MPAGRAGIGRARRAGMTGFGAFRRDAGGPAVRFERRYEASPEELWRAWTRPERIARWLGAEVVGTIAPGQRFRLGWGDDPGQSVDCVVRAMRQPELLEWEWTIPGEAPSVLRVELSPADGTGSVLVLEHRALPPDQAAGLGAGWHGFLDALATGDGSGWDDRFAELLPAYRERVAALG